MIFPLQNQSDINEAQRLERDRAGSDRYPGIPEPLKLGTGVDIDWRRFYGPGELSTHGPFKNTECGYIATINPTSYVGQDGTVHVAPPPEVGSLHLGSQSAGGKFSQMRITTSSTAVHTDPLLVGRSGNIAEGEPLIVYYPDPNWPDGSGTTGGG